MLNGTNFKFWQESVMITLGVMDLDLALRIDRPKITDTSTEQEIRVEEKWDRSNRVSLMIMKRSIPEAFRGSISDTITNAKEFLAEVETRFVKNEKSEIGTLLTKLVSMKYKDKGSIREYIMEMSNVVSKLRALKLEISDDLLVHLVLISLPPHFGQFRVSYNCQKDKWPLNELISHCVEEEERLKQHKTESAHVATTSKSKALAKRKRSDQTKDNKDAAVTTNKKQDKGKKVATSENACYFCGAVGHKKIHCQNYHAWRAKKGLPKLPEAK
ncbi:uncharacterized protein LOC144549493 [Carex rostrata]